MRGVAPLIYTDSTALSLRGDPRISRVSPSCSDRAECRVGPYFFFFLVAFFLATASPPSIGVFEIPLIGMLSEAAKICQE